MFYNEKVAHCTNKKNKPPENKDKCDPASIEGEPSASFLCSFLINYPYLFAYLNHFARHFRINKHTHMIFFLVVFIILIR